MNKKVNQFNFKDCYCGCKLSASTLKWKCKMFEDVKEADEYALRDKDNSLSTKLLVVSCLYGKQSYHNFLNRVLASQLQFDVSIETNESDTCS